MIVIDVTFHLIWNRFEIVMINGKFVARGLGKTSVPCYQGNTAGVAESCGTLKIVTPPVTIYCDSPGSQFPGKS